MILNHLKRLEVTLSIGCKLNCIYCPQALLLKKYGNAKKILSFTDFQTVVSKIAVGGWVIFNGMSEPFLNNKCIDMLQYASDNGYNISMATTLVGLHESDLYKLKDIKFQGFILHIPDKENNSKFQITGEYLRILKWVCANIRITGISCHGEIHPYVEKLVSDTVPFFNKMGNRAGNLSCVTPPQSKKGKVICSAGKWHTGWIPEMLPDGRVVLCCNDYGMKHVLGNLIEQEWDDIIHGKEFQKILSGWADDSLDILCRKCEFTVEWDTINCFENANPLWPVAIKQGLQIENFCMHKIKAEGILQKIANARQICIWGLGGFFKEDFFKNGWNEILNPQYFTDSYITEEMKELLQDKCIEPEKVLQMKDLLVIIYIKNSDSIGLLLKEHNIEYVTINEIYMD